MGLSSRPYHRSGRPVSSVLGTGVGPRPDGISIADEGIVGSIRASGSPANLSLELDVIDGEPLKVDGGLHRNTVPKLSSLRHRGGRSSIEDGISVNPLGGETFFEVGLIQP